MSYIRSSMLVVIIPEEVSGRDKTHWKKCCLLISVKERINLVHFWNLEEENYP